MIPEARSALAALIEAAGVRCVDFIPERITPPIAIMEPSSDWISSGEAYGEWRIGFDVTLVTQTAANTTATTVLDGMLEDVLAEVNDTANFYCSSVSAPTGLAVNNAEYLSVALSIYQITRL
jgi:hypothetical protein